jgi:hypothetical protein
LLLQRLVDASKDSDIPKNVPFAFAINNRNIRQCLIEAGGARAPARGGGGGGGVMFCFIRTDADVV